MKPFQHILSATDLSAHARHAIERAALICRESAGSDARLELLHVANLGPLERLRQLMGIAPAAMEAHILNAARKNLLELATSLHQRYGVTAGIHVVAGALLPTLAEEAERRSADLLVCGAKGESGIRHFALGTTASRMLSTTTLPMLVVRQQAHDAYRRILVPVDFSPSSLRAIQQARRIAPKAEIVLLHVFDVPFEGQLRYANVEEDTIHQYRILARQEATQKLQTLRDDSGLSTVDSQLIVLHGDAALRIIEQEQEADCDLIVMGKHGENLVEDLLLGSVTKHVLSESQGDVLVSV